MTDKLTMTAAQLRAREYGGMIEQAVKAATAIARDALAEADPDRAVGLLDAAMDELAAAMEFARRRAKTLRAARPGRTR